MAFDGITIAALVGELQKNITGGRIYKIAQPEQDELLLTIKNNKEQHRLVMSANPSLPLLYLTDENKKSPLQAPNFCMLLRKHIQNARILSVTQPGLERAVDIRMEHLDELGDLKEKILTIELMGKYSNIIFRQENRIIDSMKHISLAVSSVREVLPGRDYFIPKAEDRLDLLEEDADLMRAELENRLAACPKKLSQFIYQSYTGISPVMGEEICYLAKIDGGFLAGELTQTERGRLFAVLQNLAARIRAGAFCPQIVYENGVPREFGVFAYSIFSGLEKKEFSSVSLVLKAYYEEKSVSSRIRQKSADLRRIVQTASERNIKKLDLQRKQLFDTAKREQYRVYGELLHTYGYQIEAGAGEAVVTNYYDGEELKIPLDPQLSAMENAQKYFDRYGKLKRTNEALTVLCEETKEEQRYLESVMMALDIARNEEDLTQIREELSGQGYIKKKSGGKNRKTVNAPLHYVSSDGFHMYVGKNNLQNEEITFRLAEGGDWWFHAKGIPGSHVIVKCGGKEPPDATFEEAARLAAHYSKGAGQDKVEVDYIQKKHVKKPGGAKPGFVVYYTNYSMVIGTDITGIAKA